MPPLGSVPTTRPVESSESSVSFTSIGVIVPSRIEGSSRSSSASQSTCSDEGQAAGAATLVRFREKTSISPAAIALARN